MMWSFLFIWFVSIVSFTHTPYPASFGCIGNGDDSCKTEYLDNTFLMVSVFCGSFPGLCLSGSAESPAVAATGSLTDGPIFHGGNVFPILLLN